MMERAHTPGPWSVGEENEARADILSPQGRVATAVNSRPMACDVSANARLIASAPAMRRALQINAGILQQLVKVAEGFGELDRWTIRHEGEVIARCTIAEALDMANEALEPEPASV